METLNISLLASLAIAWATLRPAKADDMGQMVLIPAAAAVEWGPAPSSLPGGTKLSVLARNPSKPGPFVLRVKFQLGAVGPPHTHAIAENLTIISGTMFHETRKVLNENDGQSLAAGGLVFLPANMPHSVWAG